MANKIVPLIPSHKVYVEPFCGGAAIYFAKGRMEVSNQHDYREVLNDSNKMIYTFFKMLKERGENLSKELDYSLYSEYEHRLSKENNFCENELEMAYHFFLNFNQGFACKLNSGWGTGVRANNHPIIYRNKIESLSNPIRRLQTTYISCRDALDCIKMFDSDDSFFYCDPPYPETNQGHYGGYTQNDFEKLLDVLDKAKGSFILSCYDNDEVPKHWEKFEFESFVSASNGKDKNRKKGKECVWRVVRGI